MADGIFAQAPRHVAQLGVFGARAFERAFERRILAARLEQRQQPFFAGDGVDDDDRGDEDERVTETAPAAAGEGRLRRGSAAPFDFAQGRRLGLSSVSVMGSAYCARAVPVRSSRR